MTILPKKTVPPSSLWWAAQLRKVNTDEHRIGRGAFHCLHHAADHAEKPQRHLQRAGTPAGVR